MNQRFRENVRFVTEPQPGLEEWPPHEWFYIYRWGVSQLHLSTQQDSWENMGERAVEPGRFVLRPHWRRPYDAQTRLRAAESIRDLALLSPVSSEVA